MLTWWITLIGFIIILGIVGGIFSYFFKVAVHSDDANTIDPLPKENNDFQ